MSEADDAPGETATVLTADAPVLSVSEAVAAMAKARETAAAPPEKEPDEAPPSPPPAAEPPAEPDDTAPSEEDPGDTTQEAAPADDLPPIEPPRSWSKEDKDLFSSLPRETQERIAERESLREKDFRQRQNEAAEKAKALEAERQQAAQVRQQYEQTLPNLLAAMQSQIAGEFSDIKSWADVEKLQAEDPFRYQKYDLAMKKAQAVQQELAGIQQRQAVAQKQQWAEFARAEDAKFSELAPEMMDPAKAKTMHASVDKVLKEIGFKAEELAEAWEGKTGVSMRDHRVQLLIRDATLWREAQAKAKQVRQSPVPPVQRPGTARSARADDHAAEIASINKQLQTARGNKAIELGVKLAQLRRPAS